jgi:hypothetical protein
MSSWEHRFVPPKIVHSADSIKRLATQSAADVQHNLERLHGEITELKQDVHSHMDKWGTTSQRIEWIMYMCITGTLDFVFGIVLFGIELFIWAWAEGPLLLFGITLVVVRDLFLALCPIMLRQYKFFTVILNAILGFMEAGVDVAITALDAIFVVINVVINIINGISKLTGHKNVTNFQFKLLHWIPIDQLSYSQVKEVLSTLPPTCRRFDTSGKVLQWYAKLGLHEYTCPLARYVYPLSWFYSMTSSVLSPLYYGSAEPLLFVPTDNCAQGADNNKYDMACAGMGLSFVLLDVFLLALIGYLFLKDMWPSLVKFSTLGFYFAEVGLIDAYEILIVTLSIVFF